MSKNSLIYIVGITIQKYVQNVVVDRHTNLRQACEYRLALNRSHV